ncbi:hypothetical protein JCM11641_007946 [Rhodosporidiobolus odoratus]
MASFISTPAVYQPGKPPLLIDASPSGISGFLRSARLYFRQKKIDTDEDKISYLGEGLVGFPELYNWYNASADIHEAKTYKAFVADLQRKALPRDYIWEAKGNLRWAKQEGQDYEDWSTAMRTEHLALTEAVMSTKDFVECLLYGMDSELSVVLRNGNVLKNSGFHRDDMTNLAFPTATTVVYAATIDYGAFDIEARNEWAKIASRRLANATQLKLLGKKSLSPSSPFLASNKINNAAKNPSTTSRKPVATITEGSGTGGRTAKLTELEKDWLSATQGCFKCRQFYVNHSASDCRTWPTPGYVVPVPKGWDRSQEVPDVKPSTTTEGKVVTGFRALRVEDSDSEIDLPESLRNGTDTDEEGCVLPPLPLLVGSKRRSRSADALADSGSGLSLISDKLASKLGLVRQKLSRPKLYRLAIQGGEEFKTLSEFVRVPLRLENGSWEAGDTVLTVAPLEPPFDIILGTPFLRNHRILISLFPEPALTIAQPAPLEPIDLFADVEGPATQLEAMEGLDDEKRDEIIGSAVEQLVASVNARTEEEREMAKRAARVMKDYDDLFPSVLPALTADYLIKTTTRHRIKIEADPSKVDKIKNWIRPKTVTQVQGFLGIVQYLRKFIPQLAEHTAILTPLTRKGLTRIDHLWTEKEERVFGAIKRIVTSVPVLKPVDQDSDEPIWLMTDASKVGVGAVLLQGKDWKTAHPCGFYSRQYIAAEKNYPTHEQELLGVIAALKAWRIDLLGVHFRVLTDHDTLRHFQTQATLSKRQARWTEVLADCDYKLSYVPGKMNAVADSMSRFSFSDNVAMAILQNLEASPLFSLQDDLLYFEGTRLVVPDTKAVRDVLLHDAHDALGHLGPKKTSASLSASFYWSGMSKSVLAAGQLHSLPVPPRAFSDAALDFVGPFPASEGKDMLLTVTDRLSGYTRLMACRSKDGAKDIAELVYRGWFTLFGLPERLVSDRDKLFTSRFWRALHERVGVKLQMSTAFHPETDGRSERTNKTVVQMLRQQVARNQKDWVRHLSSTEYGINAAVNDSTGRTPFDLVLGFHPPLLPTPSSPPSSLPAVESILSGRSAIIGQARDTLAAAKVRQTTQANKKRSPEVEYAVGDMVMVDSSDRRSRYKAKGGDVRAAKLFPRRDGPYQVADASPLTSTYRLSLPDSDRAHPVFHSSKLKRYIANDPTEYASREPPRPGPIDVDGGAEYQVEAIVDEKGKNRTRRFWVKWEGYPESENTWEPLAHVEDTAALEAWEGQQG